MPEAFYIAVELKRASRKKCRSKSQLKGLSRQLFGDACDNLDNYFKQVFMVEPCKK
jgi:hypothetical protein